MRTPSGCGCDWAKRYPWITEAARPAEAFVLDGEAVILGVDGISDFNALHSDKHDDELLFCAFDILVEGGDDLRELPLHLRKTNLERLLARRPEGIFVNPFERGEIGPDLFRAACDIGLEGLVSKHRDRPYQSGRSKFWVKVKTGAALEAATPIGTPSEFNLLISENRSTQRCQVVRRKENRIGNTLK